MRALVSVCLSVLVRAARSWTGAAGWRRFAWVASAALSAAVIVGAALVLARTTASWAQQRGGASQLVVYLAQDTDAAARQALAEELGRLGGVSSVEVVAPEEALRRLRSALAADQALLDGVEPETMPASLEASLEPGVEAVLPMSSTFQALRGHPAVEDVVIEPAPADRLVGAMSHVAPWMRTLALGAGGLAALLLFAVARLAWVLPRQELAVAHLLGAGPAFQIVPRALGAAVAAATGALLGVVALCAGGLAVSAALASAPSSLDPAAAASPPPSTLALLGTADASLLVLAAALLAGAGAARAVLARESADA